MSKLVVCGDSFAKGIGCRDLDNEPYGSIVAKELGLELVNLAKGSSTNYSIMLQALYAIDRMKDVSLVLVTTTSYDRIEWFPAAGYTPIGVDLSNLDVNYHEYPPYYPGTYGPKLEGEPHPMTNNKFYKGGMFIENLIGIIDYFDTVVDAGLDPGEYYARFKNEPKKRLRMLYNYAKHVSDPRLNRMHGFGAVTMAHVALTKAGINHIMGTDCVDSYRRYINKKNHVNIDWGEISTQYPDDLPSLHASPEGHVVVANRVLRKIRENGWHNGN